ncbi:MAG: hypothetical protein ACE5JU_16800, partial [Candidatus Binatia bacterium]
MGRLKSLEEIKAMIRERTGKRTVFRGAQRSDVESVLERLVTKDPELWAAEWSRVARRNASRKALNSLSGRVAT